MLNMTNLDEEVPDAMIDRFQEHLSAVVGHYGVDALLNYIDPTVAGTIQGRLFYKVDASDNGKPLIIAMNLTNITFSESLGEKFDMLTKNGTEFDNFFNAVGDRFARHPEFKQIISDFEKKYPGKGNELQRFLSAQAAYVILENIVRQRIENNPVKISYDETERNIKLNKEKLEDLDGTSNKEIKKMVKAIKKINSDMETRMPTLTQRYRDVSNETNQILLQARKAIEQYTQNPKTSNSLKAKL